MWNRMRINNPVGALEAANLSVNPGSAQNSLSEHRLLHLSVRNERSIWETVGAVASRGARKYLVIREGPIPVLNHWAQNLRI